MFQLVRKFLLFTKLSFTQSLNWMRSSSLMNVQSIYVSCRLLEWISLKRKWLWMSYYQQSKLQFHLKCHAIYLYIFGPTTESLLFEMLLCISFLTHESWNLSINLGYSQHLYSIELLVFLLKRIYLWTRLHLLLTNEILNLDFSLNGNFCFDRFLDYIAWCLKKLSSLIFALSLLTRLIWKLFVHLFYLFLLYLTC